MHQAIILTSVIKFFTFNLLNATLTFSSFWKNEKYIKPLPFREIDSL